MIPCQHIVHYKGKTIHYLNGLYKVAEFFQTYVSMDEAKREIDKRDTEFFVNLKQLNETNKATIK